MPTDGVNRHKMSPQGMAFATDCFYNLIDKLLSGSYGRRTCTGGTRSADGGKNNPKASIF
jgi:hypothetical protein